MTYSILAHDPATGALGAVVASRFFAVGGICLHVEGRVGAMSVQAFPNPMYVRPALEDLHAGQDPQTILTSLVEPDPGQSNMLAGPQVLPAMLTGYTESTNRPLQNAC